MVKYVELRLHEGWNCSDLFVSRFRELVWGCRTFTRLRLVFPCFSYTTFHDPLSTSAGSNGINDCEFFSSENSTCNNSTISKDSKMILYILHWILNWLWSWLEKSWTSSQISSWLHSFSQFPIVSHSFSSSSHHFPSPAGTPGQSRSHFSARSAMQSPGLLGGPTPWSKLLRSWCDMVWPTRK